MVKYGRIALAVVAPLVLLAALLAGVQAQGEFPQTDILDNFNRGDESPMTGWTDVISGFQVVDFTARGTGDVNSSYYNSVFGQDVEAWVMFDTLIQSNPVMTVGIYCRYIPTTGLGYMAYIEIGETWITGTAHLVEMQSWTELGSTTLAIGEGDQLGMRCVGSDLSVHYEEWGQDGFSTIITATDSSVTEPGYIGMYNSYDSDSESISFDNFSGGTLQIEEPTPTPTPTPTLAPTPNLIGYNSVATITLSSGEVVAVNYSYTFGDMGMIAAMLLLVVATGVQFVYSITVKVWEWRDRR